MDFTKFLIAAKDSKIKEACAAGFQERQKAREIEFEKQSKSKSPGPSFYERRYTR